MTSTNTIRALRIQPGGLITEHHIPADGDEIRKLIGCRAFDIVGLEHGIDLWVDDEGLLQAEPVLNRPATILAHALGAQTALFGTAVALSVDLTTGEPISLTDEQVHRVQRTIGEPGRDVIDPVVRTLNVLTGGR